VPDTGSSNLWVYDQGCHTVACLRHDRFKESNSTSFKKDGTAFDIQYGSGGVDGVVGRDTAALGESSASMGFGLINKTSGPTFLVSQMDGIIGLGYDTISVDKLPTYITESNLPTKEFGFYLHNNPEQSYMTMGGCQTKGWNKIKEHQVIEKTYWNLNLESVQQDGKDAHKLTGIKAAIDSGTSLIVGSEDVINPLIDGITVSEDCSNLDSLPDLTFTMDGHDYTLTKDDYVLQVKSPLGRKTQCVMGIMAQKVPAGKSFPYVIVGDVFFRPYAPCFSREKDTVTFYSAATPKDVVLDIVEDMAKTATDIVDDFTKYLQ